MLNCLWNCLKYQLGFFLAIALIGLIMAGIAAVGISTGGAGLAALFAAVVETALGGAGIAVAKIGGAGAIGTLVGCFLHCV